jgi:putative phage resistance protein
MLVVDELDSSLHPTLAAELVSMFKNPDMNRTGAQLIFTSHDATLLGNIPMRLLDSPEVWFTEKNDEGASDIFSLEEFDTRPKSNIQKQYLTGAFGAIPTTYMSELRALLEAEQ